MRILLIAVAAISAAAQPAAREQPADQTVIRTTTRLVTLNVIVRDEKGPVSNLRRDDFALFDRGKPQPISVFTIETSGATLPEQPSSPERNLFTNVLEHRANTPTNITILLLDGLNTRLTDQQYARQQVKQFLDTLRPQDRISIYTLGRTLSVLQDFTADPRQLDVALSAYSGRSDSIAEASAPPLPFYTGHRKQEVQAAKFYADAAKYIQPLYQSDAARRTAMALIAIANYVAPLPGRKNLVWVSSSFPFLIGGDDNESQRAHVGRTPSGAIEYRGQTTRPGADRGNFRRELDAATRALNNACMAIYPVDAHGLVALMPLFKAESAPSLDKVLSTDPITSKPPGQETMRQLAASTGGKAFLDRNDLGSAVREAIDDSAVTYTLGFYPQPDAIDGRYHELRVEVPNRAGLNVRFRKGYFAETRNGPPIDTIKADVERALWSPLEAKGIAISARVSRESNSLRIAATISAQSLSLQEMDDRWKGTLDVATAQRDLKGKVLLPNTQSAAVNIDRPSYEYYRKNGIPYSTSVKMAAGAQELRIVVVDRTTGALGSVIIPLAEIR